MELHQPTIKGATVSNSYFQGTAYANIGGLSTQFLKADGTVDSSTYALNSALASYSLASHTHGNITNAGYLGITASIPLITGVSGIIQAGSFGTLVGTFCQGNDSRLSDARTPLAHTLGFHSNVSSTVDSSLVTGQLLRWDGTSWNKWTPTYISSYVDTDTGVTSLSAIGATPNVNSGTITGRVLNLQPASTSFGGVVTTGIQSFAGAKTFSSSITATSFIKSGGTSAQYLMADGSVSTIGAGGITGSGLIGINYIPRFSTTGTISNSSIYNDWDLSRVGINTNTPAKTLDVNGDGYFALSLTASSFVKSGGTSAQFLMADGSVSTSSGGANPAGTGTEIQYRVNGTTFGGFGSVNAYEIDLGKPLLLELASAHPNSTAIGTIYAGAEPDSRPRVRSYGGGLIPVDGNSSQTLTASASVGMYWANGSNAYMLLNVSTALNIYYIPDGASGTLLIERDGFTARTLTITSSGLTNVIVGTNTDVVNVTYKHTTITYKRVGSKLILVYGHQS